MITFIHSPPTRPGTRATRQCAGSHEVLRQDKKQKAST
jgi:hypothetical protein